MSPLITLLVLIVGIVVAMISYKVVSVRLKEREQAATSAAARITRAVWNAPSATLLAASTASAAPAKPSGAVSSFYGGRSLGRLDLSVDLPDYDLYAQQAGPEHKISYQLAVPLTQGWDFAQKDVSDINDYIEKKAD